MEQLQNSLDDEIRTLNYFISSFRSFEEVALYRYIIQEKEELAGFLDSFKDAEAKEVIKFRTLAPHYNLFRILKIAHLEDRVHSPFLANLLNPQGTHGQGTLFFDLFIDYIFNGRHPRNVSEIEIKEEYSTFDGILDIFIRCKIDEKPFYIVIENKIYAADQYRQLERYHGVLKKTFSVSDNFLLIYLTPDGRKPTSNSISLELYSEISASKNFYCLSYKVDISNILTKSITAIEASAVREVIFQYLQTIKGL
jgi:hypothetical protein